MQQNIRWPASFVKVASNFAPQAALSDSLMFSCAFLPQTYRRKNDEQRTAERIVLTLELGLLLQEFRTVDSIHCVPACGR